MKRAGAALTEEHIELLLSQELRVDESWCAALAAEPQEAELRESDFNDLSLGDPALLRRHDRHSWRTARRIEIREPIGASWERHEMTVRTHDISRSGFSFDSPKPIRLDSYVTVRLNEKDPDGRGATGIVRNGSWLGEGAYRIGVEFISSSPAE
ncbi:MAG: PilZ domain-containing protein [bacterium]|nr:PilZ domain-containing protein [bacterium]